LTQERFLRLLDNPDLLATIPYEEMKTLALAYPYAHNLRYLLALKANQDDHPDADRMLSIAAVYSLERTQLFYLAVLKMPVLQPVSVADEVAVLELKPIEIVQRELEALAPQARGEKTEKTSVQETPIQNPAVPFEAGYSLEVSQTLMPEKAETIDNQVSLKPVLAQPFALWVSRFNPPVLEPQKPNLLETPPQLEEEKPFLVALSAQELAERSVAENKDVISETLARLLAKQGYRDKAVDMYERLRLAFPEKSAYFAAEIEKLKK
jgi:hypothetical protein